MSNIEQDLLALGFIKVGPDEFLAPAETAFGIVLADGEIIKSRITTPSGVVVGSPVTLADDRGLLQIISEQGNVVVNLTKDTVRIERHAALDFPPPDDEGAPR